MSSFRGRDQWQALTVDWPVGLAALPNCLAHLEQYRPSAPLKPSETTIVLRLARRRPLPSHTLGTGALTANTIQTTIEEEWQLTD